mgnify:CR=1 FL=1
MAKKKRLHKEIRKEAEEVRRAQKKANPPRYTPPERRGKKSRIADLAQLAEGLPESRLEKEANENKFAPPEHKRKNLRHLLKGKQ